MSESWDNRKKAQEEEYFRKKEQEAIEKMRANRAAQERQAGAAAGQIGCPKCDGNLSEIVYEGVHIDRCDKCNGVWLDEGELERLTEKDDSGWFGRLRRSISGE